MNKTFIIAEAGVNHNGNIEIAKKLIDVAKEARADAVKFQTFKAENLASRYAEKANYQKQSTGNNQNQVAMLKKLQLSKEEFICLQEHCSQTGILFLSTAFDLESIKTLETMNLPLWKIPSGEITNTPYLIEIAKSGKPIILSTGMSDLDEIKYAVDLLRENGAGEITLLHCNTEYPTPFDDVNLAVMDTLKQIFKCTVGYSDHTQGIEVPIAAVAMGAEVIEKHFTLDKDMEGPDHKASLNPRELGDMIAAIRNIEKAIGDGVKRPSESEKKNIIIARKSIVAKKEIKNGEPFTENNITTKRPGNGISPTKWFEVIGLKAKKDFQEDELIEI